MNKGFLFKKSWHTAKISNQEKVWKAEQAAEEEKKKLAEWQRELEQERELERLRSMHRETTGASRGERLDWMYHAPLSSGPSAEEYLLGKAYKEQAEEKDVNKMQNVPGSIWLKNPVSADQDMVNKVRDDPLLAMKKEEQRQQQLIKQNPVQMKMLREQVLKQKLRQELEKDKMVKDKHKHKDKSKHKHKGKDKSRKRSREEDADTSSSKRAKAREIKAEEIHVKSEPYIKSETYVKSEAYVKSETSLKTEYKPNTHVDRRDKRGETRQPTKLSPEERERRLKEMQENAVKHAENRWARLTKDATETQKELDEASKAVAGDKLQASFINELGQSVYKDKQTASLEDRLSRGRYYLERGARD